MSDDILIDFYNSLLDDEILKIIINSINDQPLETEDDFEAILENCLEQLKEGELNSSI
jgi:hypothetical protein